MSFCFLVISGGMEVLDIFDDIERRFMTTSTEVHRICIPTTDAPGHPLRKGLFKFRGGNPVAQHTDLCEARSIENGFPCSEGGLDLKLSPDALEQPNQAFVDGFERILEMKFGIMASRIRHGIDTWTLASYMVNPFESLSFVAEPSVLNRAYFKMWELIRLFEVVPLASQCQTFFSAHLCEGPGGFIEAVLDSRTRSGTSENLAQTISDGTEREGDTGNVKQCDGFHNSLQKIVPNHQESASVVSEVPSFDSPEIFYEQNSPHPAKKLKRHPGRGSEVKDATKNRRNAKAGIQLSNGNSIRKADTNGSSHDNSPSTLSLKKVDIAALDVGRERTAAISDSERAGGEINLAHASGVTKKGSEASNPISGPGGRARKPPRQYQDMWFGITLAQSKYQRDDAGYPPPSLETAKLSEKVAENSTGNVFYGVDGSGDVTNPANMHAFVEHTLSRCNGRKMDLVTADGAFDVSDDFSAQEHSHLYLVFCEMVSAVRLQAEGGSFILKLFDCYAESTLTVLFVLSKIYSSVEVVRLRTTRICNSERYVVATGFLGLDATLQVTLLKLTDEWHSCTLKGEKVGLCVEKGLPATLLDAVMESNTAIAASQIDGISRALELADVIGERLPSPNSAGSRKGAVSMLRRKVNMVKSKQRNAVALCKELQIPCRSHFRGRNCDCPPV